MKKLKHTFCFRLSDEELQMYDQLLSNFPLACFKKTRSSRFRALLKSLSRLESYREKGSEPFHAWGTDEEGSDLELEHQLPDELQ